MPLKQQKLPNSDYQQSSWARGYWSNNFLEKRATTTFFQLCHWRKQKSVNLQHLRRMCEMCCSMKKRRAGEGTDGGEEEEEEEDCCNQGWALHEVQTDAGCACGPWWSAVLLLSRQTIYTQTTDSLWARKRKLLHLLLFLLNQSMHHLGPSVPETQQQQKIPIKNKWCQSLAVTGCYCLFCGGPCRKKSEQPESEISAEIKGQLCSLDSSDQKPCWQDATLTSSIIEEHQDGASTWARTDTQWRQGAVYPPTEVWQRWERGQPHVCKCIK